MRSTTHAALLDRLVPVVLEAGRVVMAVYATDFEVENKGDASPVTRADRQAEAAITAALVQLEPDIPVVGEEAVSDGHLPPKSHRFWLVDPLDGTKEFVGRNGEFTVNIALVDNGQPVLGVVFAPALDALYGGGPGLGAWVQQGGRLRSIACRRAPPEGLTVAASRSHGDAAALEVFLDGRKVARHISAGSSLKLCLVAAGQADVYPRLGRTMEWDIAAGHAVLSGAGGSVLRADGGGPLTYGKPGFENPHFAAWGLR